MTSDDLNALKREIKESEQHLSRLKKQLEHSVSRPIENAAPCYPYSPRAQEIMARHNHLPVEALPEAMRWASNQHMAAWLDLLGAAMEMGRPHRDPDGRWWSVKRLMEGE